MTAAGKPARRMLTQRQKIEATQMNILDLPMQENDAGAATVRDYLKALLSRIWEEEESFSGKRPFGNSGWKSDIETTLVKAGVIAGKLDSDGYLEECASAESDALIQAAIAAMR